MNTYKLPESFLVILILLFNNCTGSKEIKVGGPCEYEDFPGQILINSVEPDKTDSKKAIVKFDFSPIDNSRKYRFGNFKDTGIHLLDGNENPDKNKIEFWGVKKGKNFPAIRKEIKFGACTPVIFEVPSFK